MPTRYSEVIVDRSSPPEDSPSGDEHSPRANRGLQVASGVLLTIPIAALLWVGSYARETPKLGAFPFFIWYQLMWVFITAGLTWTAYLLVVRARPSGVGPRHARTGSGER